MSWTDTLIKLAPTVVSALGSPLAGGALALLGEIFGLEEPTQEKIEAVFRNGQLTGEQITQLKELEMKLQAEERERGFRYAELTFKDRDSARRMQMETQARTPAVLTWIIVILVLAFEGGILMVGVPEGVSEIVTGRVLGTLDMSLMMVLAYWFGHTYSSGQKNELLAKAPALKD